MKEFKGTKGPWEFHESSCKIVCSSSAITVADTYDSYCEYGENTANANLIAAAPELLEALQEIREEMKAFRHVANEVGINDADGIYLGHTKGIMDKASAAIARALSQ